MDVISTVAAFLLGTATGASGQYFAMKYTDQRHRKEKVKEKESAWSEFEKRFPELSREMREDFSHSANRNVRAFYPKSSKTTLNGKPEPAFEYYTDVHDNLQAAVLFLEHHGFVSDITPGNCPMFRIKETMAELLVPKSVTR